MTADNVPAGRELDVLVAEQVMGFVRVTDDTSDYNHVRHGNEVLLPPGATLHSLREWLPRKGQIPFGYFVTQRYSTDIAAAWRVVERLRDQGYRFALKDQPGTGIRLASFFNENEYGAMCGDTTDATAICRTALAVHGVVLP